MYDDLSPLLHHARITGITQKIPDRNFLAQREIFTAKETESAETFGRDIIYGHRTPAKINAISSRAKISAHEKIGQQWFRLGEVKLKRKIDERTLLYARRLGTNDEKMFMGWITKTVTELKNEIAETVEKALWDAMTGTLTVDNRTDPENPVYWQNTYAITQVNSPAINGWVSSPDEKILSTDLTALANLYRNAVGVQLARALTTSEVTDGLIRNTELKAWYKATNNNVLNSQTIGNISYLTLQAYDEGYESTRYSGSVTKYIPANTIYMMPAGNDRIGATIVEGPNLIPKNAFGAETGGGLFEEVGPGYFAYSVVTDDPVGVWIYVGYKFAPVIYRPETILKFTVV